MPPNPLGPPQCRVSWNPMAERGCAPRVVLGVVFDGDDTLWSTEQLYDDARSRARRVVADSGLDGAKWEELDRLIDVENVTRFGHSIERFPTSCAQAYEDLCRSAGQVPDPSVAERIRDAARSVF